MNDYEYDKAVLDASRKASCSAQAHSSYVCAENALEQVINYLNDGLTSEPDGPLSKDVDSMIDKLNIKRRQIGDIVREEDKHCDALMKDLDRAMKAEREGRA